ncbi:MAG TPA: DUF1223 domain-containing protein [Chitinophagaceae bacterium]|nr:DUF1223 domain-containing protein [Chitinophagaceae bacterium]
MYFISKKTLTVLFFGFSSFATTNKVKELQHNTAPQNGFAVVELFTSEGCSSCPPADAVAAKLLEDYKENVFVLGFHVDYWNYLGWKDNFSSSAYNARQQQYGNIFQLNSVYTPQVVVNGTQQFVGSDKTKLYDVVKKSLQQSGTNEIKISAIADGKTIKVTYTLQIANAILNFALVQKHATTKVQRGENSGSTLQHVNVVRDFISVRADITNSKIELTLPDGLLKDGCTIIAFLQDNKTLKISAATECVIQ